MKLSRIKRARARAAVGGRELTPTEIVELYEQERPQDQQGKERPRLAASPIDRRIVRRSVPTSSG